MRNVYSSLFETNLEFKTGNKCRYDSFSPIIPQTLTKWYVCGETFMEGVAEALENAKTRIFITDWQISPRLYLKRPFCPDAGCRIPDPYWRFDEIIKRKANQGVRIYFLIYQDPANMGLRNYEAGQFLRRFNREPDAEHGNIFCLTHPTSEGPLIWAHHEKLVVCDEKVAFVSGIDLGSFSKFSRIFEKINILQVFLKIIKKQSEGGTNTELTL